MIIKDPNGDKAVKIKERYPVIKNAGNILAEACTQRLGELYGDSPLQEIAQRLTDELHSIIQNNNETVYLVFKHIVDKARQSGEPTGSRTALGSSFVAFLLGCTPVNPLQPHYHCKACKHVEFVPGAASGFDLPDRPCPHCGGVMSGDGHDLPFKALSGLVGEKVLDIDIDVPRGTSVHIKELLEALFPDDVVLSAGAYSRSKKEVVRRPGSYMVIPQQYVEDIPVAYVGENHDIAVTVQDYRELIHKYYKIGVRVSSNLKCLCELATETGIALDNVPVNDPKVLQALQEGGTCAFNEFGTIRRDKAEINFDLPKGFSELVEQEQLRYPFPKPKIIYMMMIILRMMWCKINYPDVFNKVMDNEKQFRPKR